MTKRNINSWSDLQLQDLFYAYRKAKADCYFERSLCIAQAFAEYEADLPAHLYDLLGQLKAGNVANLLKGNIGTPRLIAKKLTTRSKRTDETASKGLDGHGYFSDPGRAFLRLQETSNLEPELRLVGDFPVTMHILSALWINLVGHKFDAALSGSAYGSRLRRYRAKPRAAKGVTGEYHLDAVGSFEPYFEPYKQWRKQGLQAIRRELEEDRAVVAVSLDLTSFYHQIDPAFFATDGFLAAAGIELNGWEHQFTKALSEALAAWSDLAATQIRSASGLASDSALLGGLPIGLSAVRIIANALLIPLDRDIEKGLTPVYYGRYVDDVFLVIRDPADLTDTRKLLEFISSRTKYFPQEADQDGNVYLKRFGDYVGRTVLSLQQTKQKAFFLQGQGGLDLLDNIESQIRQVSSERRLMPSPDHLGSMASAKVLTAAADPSEEADTLRRADGLAVRRLGWAVQLRAVEMLARDLRQDDWKKERTQFYQFAHNHILRPDKILDHIDYLPRLLSLAVALKDWADASRLIHGALGALRALADPKVKKSVKLNGISVAGADQNLWVELEGAILRLAKDAIIRSLGWDARTGKPRPLTQMALSVCRSVDLGSDVAEIYRLALILREADWAKTAYKDHLRRYASHQRLELPREQEIIELYPREHDLRTFLERSTNGSGSSADRVHPRCAENMSSNQKPSLIPFLFPTRPYSTQEISLFLPFDCVFGEGSKPVQAWARYTRAVRGVWVHESSAADIRPDNDSSGDPEPPKERQIARLGGGASNQKILLGISSLLTTDDSWSAGASGKPDLSRGRYERIRGLINQAIAAQPRPTHLLLPELALPERWIGTVSGLLRDAGISLIAGLDYHLHNHNEVHSAAALVLADDRLGFSASVEIRQRKSLPAPGEEENLLKHFGLVWQSGKTDEVKPVYIHKGFCFGVLVCSELQNVKHRLGFQGGVDCMMVLSWNQDLETFSALVEAASLDVHASIALVNNRRFGDSRVRAPAKQQHLRDICRLRGGDNDHIVVVELDVGRLRAFQNRAKRWPSKEDSFKPVPEGFALAPYRRAMPR
ncbi:hypothetical protein DC522_19060 [Microvirga sp. KLBC 81]|uniref:RNA-directed DNA polymerase n=1 Tax=Microvirga sp. KLBC 81 TaxID=1862707 RepID=UPI000D521325|nr:RNA-directed DNA polymerase [Microvirga sp. KLBC 81]PVE22861.1 hypothetical protein DC522_19060 [Microvirga sp. KLBC 81]